jgi:hypothetical protein
VGEHTKHYIHSEEDGSKDYLDGICCYAHWVDQVLHEGYLEARAEEPETR